VPAVCAKDPTQLTIVSTKSAAMGLERIANT
jgi:hypothetical protein